MKSMMHKRIVMLIVAVLLLAGGSVSAQPTDWIVETYPSCTTAGRQYYIDENGVRHDEVIPAQGHHYNTTVYAATCGEPQRSVHTCVVCGESYSETQGASLGHNYVPGNEQAATCTQPGYKETVCNRCGDTRREDVPALGHDFGSWTAVQDADGEKTEDLRVCRRCGSEEHRPVAAITHYDGGTTTSGGGGLAFPLTVTETTIVSTELILLAIFVYLIYIDLYRIYRDRRERKLYKKELQEERELRRGHEFN